ncbi:hypothetical protein [Thermoplasma acidophilum]|uniref:Uncharacterized protein n=1 Tax=Thermoplasma acidophilum (strain ATCC 25905 / DSM 1728 / JCM 9062 / NBRC 15155 / AMRC-C165) TaxID=273075 RepID=Q9HJQ9_THEAC|nr:hypothetical protein [Thermoplasma acidophilum]
MIANVEWPHNRDEKATKDIGKDCLCSEAYHCTYKCRSKYNRRNIYTQGSQDGKGYYEIPNKAYYERHIFQMPVFLMSGEESLKILHHYLDNSINYHTYDYCIKYVREFQWNYVKQAYHVEQRKQCHHNGSKYYHINCNGSCLPSVHGFTLFYHLKYFGKHF